MRALAAPLALIALFSAPLAARAATCGKPDLMATFPAGGAEGVPSNARLSAYYAPNAVYDDEPVVLEREGTADEVPASFDPAEVALHVEPPEGLSPGVEYVVQWPRLRGAGTTSIGTGEDVGFTVSSGTDDAAPDFEGLVSLDWDVTRGRDECTDSMEERFYFDLAVGRASDDAGAGNLALIVFQTRGPQQGPNDPPKPVAVVPYPGEGEKVRVERALADGGGLVCFAALVRDLVPDHAPSQGNGEQCAGTTLPPFFYGCMLAPARRGGAGGRAALGAALALVVSLRLRRSRGAGPAS